MIFEYGQNVVLAINKKTKAFSCWALNCHQDKRIRLDFENMIINPDIN